MNGVIEQEALELEGTAWWRSEKVDQYPDDSRNSNAEELLQKLAKELRGISESPKAKAFQALHDFIFNDDGDDTDSPIDVVRRWSDFRSKIGFSTFPDSAEEYLDELMDIARDAS